MPLDFNPDAYHYWLGISRNEADAMIAGSVPDAVKQELRELIVLLNETPAEKHAKRQRKKVDSASGLGRISAGQQEGPARSTANRDSAQIHQHSDEVRQ